MASIRLFPLLGILAILIFSSPGFSAESSPEIVRGLFCSAVTDREPVDQLLSATPDQGNLYFFTEVSGATGNTLLHRWLHDGWTIAEVPLTIGASRWRTWSSKQIWHLGKGQLTVQVLNGDGEVLLERAIPVSTEMGTQEPSDPESTR